ncbi:MAG: DNA methyltransferase, partial [Bacteroidota bacterium]
QITTWTNEGDLVYDPFIGSGTTAKIAKLLNRKWLGSEISKEYVEIAEERINPIKKQSKLNFSSEKTKGSENKKVLIASLL